jgi:hypothetical protein
VEGWGSGRFFEATVEPLALDLKHKRRPRIRSQKLIRPLIIQGHNLTIQNDLALGQFDAVLFSDIFRLRTGEFDITRTEPPDSSS